MRRHELKALELQESLEVGLQNILHILHVVVVTPLHREQHTVEYIADHLSLLCRSDQVRGKKTNLFATSDCLLYDALHFCCEGDRAYPAFFLRLHGLEEKNKARCKDQSAGIEHWGEVTAVQQAGSQQRPRRQPNGGNDTRNR